MPLKPQTVLREQAQEILVQQVNCLQAGNAVRHLLSGLPYQADPIPIGVSVQETAPGQITAICLASTTQAISINFAEHDKVTFPPGGPFARVLRGAKVLNESPNPNELLNSFILVGFGMSKLAILVNQRTGGLHVRGVDLATLFSIDTWKPLTPSQVVSSQLTQNVDHDAINAFWDGKEHEEHSLYMRAWISACVGQKRSKVVEGAAKIDTTYLNFSELACLTTMVIESQLLERAKPRETPNEFDSIKVQKDGSMSLLNARYKNRVRRSAWQTVILTNSQGHEYTSRAGGIKGRTTNLRGTKFSGTLQNVRVVGRQEPTNSERAQEELILLILRGEKDIRTSAFIRLLWFPQYKSLPSPSNTIIPPGDALSETMDLNASQQRVVVAMTSGEPIVIVHGPPGTGKTTTICAASKIWAAWKCPVWIVAHSNVAVKNIASTLHKREVDFKILVSKEFYVEWHEHLYEVIEGKLIRSDELPKDRAAMERLLGDSYIILSTLSMLSNPMLQQNGTFDCVPVERIIVDEASQIRNFEYMHIFQKFPALEKVCFFGDPHQLPPFGQEQAPSIRTIFDVPHLQSHKRAGTTYLLDTQYRMPVPLGSFISNTVYSNKLHSQHSIKTPDCIRFVNVPAPRGEETRGGFSWKNMGEIKTIVHLVSKYYKNKNFAIITPYDAQRAAIEKVLKDENLPWENVFNVDSFQGNERDYILISAVRTNKPGFLTVLNRANVMLTRCRKGMVIVANQTFLQTTGRATLLRQLADHWDSRHGNTHQTWVNWDAVANGLVNLPGSPAPNKSLRGQPGGGTTPAIHHPTISHSSHYLSDLNSIYGSRRPAMHHWAGWFPNLQMPSTSIRTQSRENRSSGNNKPPAPTFTYDDFPTLPTPQFNGSGVSLAQQYSLFHKRSYKDGNGNEGLKGWKPVHPKAGNVQKNPATLSNREGGNLNSDWGWRGVERQNGGGRRRGETYSVTQLHASRHRW